MAGSLEASNGAEAAPSADRKESEISAKRSAATKKKNSHAPTARKKRRQAKAPARAADESPVTGVQGVIASASGEAAGRGKSVPQAAAPGEAQAPAKAPAKKSPPTRRGRRKKATTRAKAREPAPATSGGTESPGEGKEETVKSSTGAEPSPPPRAVPAEPVATVEQPKRESRPSRGGRIRKRDGRTKVEAGADGQPAGPPAETSLEQPAAGAETRPKSAGAEEPTAIRKKSDRPVSERREREERRDPRSAAAAGREGTPRRAPAANGTAKARERKQQASSRPREMIINVASGAECRIAVLEKGRLEELYIERQSAESHVGSIYKGRITNVEPSIQAVFIDFGQPRNGFLHISDVHPQYFPERNDVSENVGKKIPRRDRPLIQQCFRRGAEVVVQVTKEGVGTKGPTLTTYLSIPGRFLVMMPGMSRVGVSRKIEDQTERRAMREVLSQLPLPEGTGFILRTAGLGRSKRDLERDLNYLKRLWKIISDRTRKLRGPAELFQESDLVIRTIRDVLTSDFGRIVVDDESTAEKAQEFLRIALPRTQNLVELHRDPQPIFHKFGIEEEIERINSRHVPLPLGGSLVIEPTEAMVAIDVNSGRFRDVDDAEKSAYQINLQAAEEIARQLRLRDLGGLIVCDFIDMRLERHRREVERTLRNALKKHKERARILRMSQFGLIEMTRQRQRPSLKRSIYAECPHCQGSGLVKTTESMVLEVMRLLQLAAHQPGVRKITTTVCPEVAFVIQNQKRARLHELEEETDTVLTIGGDLHYAIDQIGCECEDERGRPVKPPS